MHESLHDRVLEGLLADEALSSSAVELVNAACIGDEALGAALRGQPAGLKKPGHASEAVTATPPSAYLSQIEATGFRGIGPPARLDLEPGPGLTLVVGRNGSGKSSFSEAAEFALTGSSKRWEDRTPKREWRQGWRNLHHDGAPRVRLEAVVEGRGPVEVIRQWPQSARAVEDHEVRGASLDDLGWTAALAVFRPILSYNELGSMLVEGPSKLYDALETILGLEELTGARERISRIRIDGEKQRRDVRKAGRELVPELRAMEDGRATRCAVAVDAWDLDALADIVLGEDDGANDAELRDLRALAALEPPADEAILRVVEGLATARGEAEKQVGSRADRDRRLADLLKRALHHHEVDGDGDCPVCGSAGALDADWHARTEHAVAELEAESVAALEARKALDGALVEARKLLDRPIPPAVARAGDYGLPTDASQAWAAWRSGSTLTDAESLERHLEQHLDALQHALRDLRAAAAAALEHRQSVWRPTAERLGEWLAEAREVRSYEGVRAAVQQGEDWLKGFEDRIRSERFDPIAQRARDVWALLRQDSHVDLAHLALAGTGRSRGVELGVTVDGQEGAALGVMSQGELHSLALSLFLPRATLPESPFGFLLIDDPVQSMDPHKVDGLAEVLREVSTTHQVVVFTHDARLPEAVRRMQIAARIVAVSRGTGSVLVVEDQLDPIEQHLRDARQILRDIDHTGRGVASRLVPLFCRYALEAAFERVIRRRRLSRGEAHADVEELVKGLKTHDLATVALFDDPKRGAEVLAYFNRKWGPWAADVLQACKNTHTPYNGDLDALQHDTWTLAWDIAGVRS